MKKCVMCRTQIEEIMPYTLCCGGSGIIEKVFTYLIEIGFYYIYYMYSFRLQISQTMTTINLHHIINNI